MKKKLLFILSVIMLTVCCVFGASAYTVDRPYDNADKYPPEYYKIIDGVVYNKAYDRDSKKYYYTVRDYFATDELAEKATEIINLRSEIDGIPVTELRFYDSSNRSYSNIKKINIPNSVKVIGEYAFKYFSGVEALEIPDSVEEIELGAFAGMSSLKKITLPEKVRSVSPQLFSGCVKLSRVTFKGDIVSIGASAFKNCTSLKKITLPETVSRIGGSAFARSGLTSITIPVVAYKGSYHLGDEDEGPVFKDCKKLKKVVFSDAKVEYFTISGSDFRNCTSLEKVYFPKSAKKILIADNAFRNCKKLSKIYNTGNVTVIEDNAFRGCKALTGFTISSKVTEIGKTAFYGCTKLKKVTVNSKKKAPAIGKKAFGKTAEGIKFVAKNSTAAKSWKSAVKKSGLKNMKVCYVKYVNV